MRETIILCLAFNRIPHSVRKTCHFRQWSPRKTPPQSEKVCLNNKQHAWLRTGLAALASGVGAKALLTGVIAEWVVLGAGTVLTLFSAFCFLAGVWRDLFAVRPPKPDIQRLPIWLLLIVNGSLALVALAALASIWLPLF